MAHLFSKLIIAEVIKSLHIPDLEKKISLLSEWLDMYNTGTLQKKSEKEFEGVYNETLFGEILGYTSISSSEYTREKEPKNPSNGQKPDIGLGYYSSESHATQAVVELKDAATSLDRPQQRAGNLTPIQQAFKYKPLYNSKWVIVSNFFEIRLYKDTYQDFESFTLRELVDAKNDYENFRRFYALFHASRLISKNSESETERLLAKVRVEEEKISKIFYKEYKDLRLELMRDIWKNNPDMQNANVIEKAQRIIDRIVFICFCEDRGLIPQNELRHRVEQAKKFGFAPWEMLRKFFQSIDSGDVNMGIPDGYNGGLFRKDDTIDALKISDEIIEKFVALGAYDFSEDGGQLSVEILGHIFEQSISDIEEIRTKIESSGLENPEKEEKKISKRKKDGIFYTPAYIVDYIVRNSLGKYLEEHEESLKVKYALKEDINEKNYRKREIDAYTEYQKILHDVKVLDPACGSGAFLVRVFDFLLEENKRVANILYIEGDQIRLGDDENYFREILRNNIYGVDLNEESVEITKLSLWLKSAQRGKKLVTLDDNIKCGNSLIDDPSVAGDKAFDWNAEFADIMARGGFDVIVGNPPYVQLSKAISTSDEEKGYLLEKYQTSGGRLNTYIFFIHLAKMLLGKKGKLGYIIPNTLLTQDYYKNSRNLIISPDFGLSEVVIYSGMEFTDAVVETMTILVDCNYLGNSVLIKKQESGKINIINEIKYADIRKDLMFRINPNTERIATNIIKRFPKIKNNFFINQAIALKGDKSLSVFNEYNPIYKKLIDGRHIRKYSLSWGGDYLDYNLSRIHSCKTTDIFNQPKIFFRRVSSNLVATYDEDNYFALNTLVVITMKNNLKLKYLLSIFNSKLMNYCYSSLFKSSKKVFSEIQARSVGELPLPELTSGEQQPFIDQADIMLTLNKELHEKSNSFLKNISAKYKIEKVSRKLEKWWELDFAEFVKELKVKISLEAQEELMSYFEKRKSEVRDIIARIDATDKEIDEIVFDLYGLTEEERRVVLESK